MIVTTAEESRSLDRSVMEKYGLPEDVLMENAGASVVRLTEGAIRWAGASVTILCGTGNNGGDGMVTARYAAEAGAGVLILLMGNPAIWVKAHSISVKRLKPWGYRLFLSAGQTKPFPIWKSIHYCGCFGGNRNEGNSLGEKKQR